MAKKQTKETKLTKEVKEAKKEAKKMSKLVKRVDKLVKQDMLPEKAEFRPEEHTAEQMFELCDSFLVEYETVLGDSTYGNKFFEEAKKDYLKACEVEKFIASETLRLKTEEEQIKNSIRVGEDTGDAVFDKYYKAVRDLHLILGKEIALLNRKAASAVNFYDQIRKCFLNKEKN